MENLPINPLDGAVLAIILISGLMAYLRGFVDGVLSILVWIGAGAAAIYGLPHAKPFLRQIIGIEWIADIASGVIVFVVSLFVLGLIARSLASRVQESGLSQLDRSLGLLFGLLRGALIVCVAFIFIVDNVWTKPERPAWVAKAKSTPLIDRANNLLRKMAPGEIAAAEGAGKTVSDQAKKALEAERALRKLTQPDTQPSGGAGNKDGYANDERQGLDRLFEANQ